jgi:hypothetical protein
MFEGLSKILKVSIDNTTSYADSLNDDPSHLPTFYEKNCINSKLVLKRDLLVKHKNYTKSIFIVDLNVKVNEEIKSPSAHLFIETPRVYEKDDIVISFELISTLHVNLPLGYLDKIIANLDKNLQLFISGDIVTEVEIPPSFSSSYFPLKAFEFSFVIGDQQVPNWYSSSIELQTEYLIGSPLIQHGQVRQIISDFGKSSAINNILMDDESSQIELIRELISDLRTALKSEDYKYPNIETEHFKFLHYDIRDFERAIVKLPKDVQKSLIKEYGHLWGKFDVSAALAWGENLHGAIDKGFEPKQEDLEFIAIRLLKLQPLRSTTLESILINSLIYAETIAFGRNILSKEKMFGVSIPAKIIKSDDQKDGFLNITKIMSKALWIDAKRLVSEVVKIGLTYFVALAITQENTLAAWVITTGYTFFRWWKVIFTSAHTKGENKLDLLKKMTALHSLANNYNYNPQYLREQLIDVSNHGAVFSPLIFSLLDLQIEDLKKSDN